MTEPLELSYVRGELSVSQIEREIERFRADPRRVHRLVDRPAG